jgi:hypothetical protein
MPDDATGGFMQLREPGAPALATALANRAPMRPRVAIYFTRTPAQVDSGIGQR